ncbi:hypothetical protein H5P28_12420 [Ruficoccus amylovorans]|uniref:Uncharacterized protein n=1 Tax=Ruficoccus amylovorans TaxID=1804625 RepID=A0A842HEW3_9BACT|nr:hypothetical protein [Ruficoccus amylovorans]MBC2595063.1 hypothetical protein [Ruficoccus amylovorans]
MLALKNGEKGDNYKTVAFYPGKKDAKVHAEAAWAGFFVHITANKHKFFFAQSQKIINFCSLSSLTE